MEEVVGSSPIVITIFSTPLNPQIHNHLSNFVVISIKVILLIYRGIDRILCDSETEGVFLRAKNIYYIEEKKHAVNRLIFLVVLTFLSFIFFERTGNEIIPDLFLSSIILSGLILISLLHYAFIVRYPHRWIVYRRRL